MTVPPSPKTYHSSVENTRKSEKPTVAKLTQESTVEASATPELPPEQKIQVKKENTVAMESRSNYREEHIVKDPEVLVREEIPDSGSKIYSTPDKVPLYKQELGKEKEEENESDIKLPENQHIQVCVMD